MSNTIQHKSFLEALRPIYEDGKNLVKHEKNILGIDKFAPLLSAFSKVARLRGDPSKVTPHELDLAAIGLHSLTKTERAAIKYFRSAPGAAILSTLLAKTGDGKDMSVADVKSLYKAYQATVTTAADEAPAVLETQFKTLADSWTRRQLETIRSVPTVSTDSGKMETSDDMGIQ